MKGLHKLKTATEQPTVPTPEPPPAKPDEYERVTLGPVHREHKAYLEGKGHLEWDEEEGCGNTHTAALVSLHEHFAMKGEFSTSATGKELPKDRNCAVYPMKVGAWRVVLYGNAQEPGWEKTKNGFATCVLNKAAPREKSDADTIVSEALTVDKFFNWQGVAYVEIKRREKRETLLVGSDAYARLLRVRHRNKHHQVAKGDWIKNAVDQLIATAIEEGPEIPIYVRMAYIDDKLIIDLADREGNVVIIDGKDWQVVKEAPVRFLHSEKMLPLPIPKRDGSLLDLKPFVNVEDDDFPLLIGAILGMLHPTGPYPAINLIGGDGRAKTCTATVIMLLVDPSIVKGCSPPETNEDLILAVLQRWIYFIDNLSDMKPWLSDSCCRVSTGSAMERRTKYKDRETSAFVVKRPMLITSIRDVITHPDLNARTLKFDLPQVTKRMPEKKLWDAFEKARPKILGALYTAISTAIRNLPTTKVKDLPRLADFALWCQAAEEATGLVKKKSDKGIILRTYAQARDAAVEELLSDDTAQKVIAFAPTKEWSGTGKKLADLLELGLTKDREVKEFVGDLRTLQTALESRGVLVGFRLSHGRKLITVKKMPSIKKAQPSRIKKTKRTRIKKSQPTLSTVA
jgi:hypothetical protein